MKISSWKKRSLAALLTLVMLMLVGCGEAATAPDASAGTEQETESTETAQEYMISLGSGANGGTFYILGSGIGSIIEKHNSNITCAVEATGASVENTKLIGSEQLELVLTNPSEVNNALAGVRDYEGTPYDNIRMIAAGPLMPNHVIVPKNSSIQKVEDLKGKRVSTGPGGSAQQLCAYNLLEVFGISGSDIDEKNLSINDAVTAMKDGNLDCIMYNGTAPVAALIDLASSIDIRFISFTDEEIDEACKRHPGEYTRTDIPAGTYNGQDETVTAFGVYTMLVTNDAQPDDLIYAVTKTIFENTDELAEIHASGATFSLDNGALTAGLIPFHPGAEKYLKEVGVIK